MSQRTKISNESCIINQNATRKGIFSSPIFLDREGDESGILCNSSDIRTRIKSGMSRLAGLDKHATSCVLWREESKHWNLTQFHPLRALVVRCGVKAALPSRNFD